MKKLVIIMAFLGAPSLYSMDGFYIGGRVGQVGLTGTLATAGANGLGYGLDFGLRSSAVLEIMLAMTRSYHSGNLNLTSITPSAELHLGRLNDFGFTVGFGPGFYLVNQGSTNETLFGLHAGIGGDVWIEDQVRIGLEFRYHNPFGGAVGDPFWQIMMRVGFVLE